MPKHYIGIDGGGTHSRLAAIGVDKEILARTSGGSTNLNSLSEYAVSCNIQTLLDPIEDAGIRLRDCLGICIGSAGASTGDNAALLDEIFRDIGYTCKVKVMNDAELVLTTETGGKPGVIIVSGTGSVGYAVDKNGAIIRAGGWGHIIDDGGSGYRIGMDAIKAAMMAYDGRGQQTMLASMVAEFLGFDSLDQVTSYVYGIDFAKAKIAEVAMLVAYAASQGDTVAIAIEKHAAAEIVDLARALITKAQLQNDEYKLVLNGGVVLHNKNISSIVETEISSIFPKIQIVQVSQSAELGAAYLAMG